MTGNNTLARITIVITLFLLMSCAGEVSRNKEMIDLLSGVAKSGYNAKNAFSAEARFNFYDSSFKKAIRCNTLVIFNLVKH